MASILDIRKKIPEDIFTYQQLVDCLSQYRKKRDRISEFLAREEIIRLKKGLYIFAKELRNKPVDLSIAANLIYGPSYLSCEYALSYYGLIPERVEIITSITTGKTCRFDTPLGIFTYQKREKKNYAIGVVREQSGNKGFLIASPEKALYDKVFCDQRAPCVNKVQIAEFLAEDLRFDLSRIAEFNPTIIRLLRDNSRGRMRIFSEFLLEYQL